MALAGASAAGPWWGSPALAVGGVILGVIFTQFFQSRNARRDLQQSMARTVAQDALLAATHFLDEVNKYFNYVVRHGDHPDNDDDLYLAWARLPLTTSPAVYEAGDTLIQECLGVCHALIRARSDPKSETSLSDFHRARAIFINHVRQERGLPLLTHEALDNGSSGIADRADPTSITD